MVTHLPQIVSCEMLIKGLFNFRYFQNPQKMGILVEMTDDLFEYMDMPQSRSRVLLGMSGGVDSTLAAQLLSERGCVVTGATMSSWNDDLPLPPNPEGRRNSCYGPDETIDIAAAKKFCTQLGISHVTVDVRDAYRVNVLEYFRSEYRAGRTPNPCIRCNPTVKFGALLAGARSLGVSFDYFCTGHYARLVRPLRNFIDGWDMRVKTSDGNMIFPLLIHDAFDVFKSQTYFLYRIPHTVLENVRFPLGNMTKKQVFEIARQKNLAAAERAESQDFVPSEYFPIILSDKPPIEGDITDLDGRVLGRHKGIEHYTVGQRRGLGVSSSEPLYVHSIDATGNRVVLGHDADLYASSLVANDWVWAGGGYPQKPFRAQVKIRLASKPAAALIEPTEISGTYKITFENPQRAVAPGQSAVVYYEGTILGGGIIVRG